LRRLCLKLAAAKIKPRESQNDGTPGKSKTR